MILYVCAAVFAVGLALGGGGITWWRNTLDAKHEQELAEAQAKVDELVADAHADYTKAVADETAAYILGEENAKSIARTIQARGQQYAANDSALNNPVCVLPAAGLQLLIAARSGILPAADSGRPPAGVPGTGAGQSGQPGRGAVVPGGVPHGAGGSGAVAGVPIQQGGVGAGSQVPGQGANRRPKPRPIQ